MKNVKKQHYIKILRGFSAIILLFSTVFIVLYISAIYRDYRKNQKLEFDSKARSVSAQLDQHYTMMNTLIMDLVMREDFFEALRNLRNVEPDNPEFHNRYRDMINCFVEYTYFQTDYDMIYLDERGYYYNNTYFASQNSFPLLKVEEEELSRYTWMDFEESTSIQNISGVPFSTIKENALTMIQRIRVPTVTAGYLIAQKDLSKDYVFLELEKENIPYAVYDQSGALLLQSDQMKTISEDRYKEAHYGSDVTGMYTVLFYPKNQVFWEMMDNVWPFIVFTLTLLAITFWIAVRWAIFLSEPLNFLEKQLKNTNYDNLRIPLPPLPKSASIEMANLQETYSEMRFRLAEAMDEKISLAEEKEKQKYLLLQYQMNPHFLHNTLNVIGILGIESGNENVARACQRLADLLRYALQSQEDGATFEEEFENVESYLELMKLRYEYKMNYSLHLDETLKLCKIPRLVLQPFVENVFEHGFDREHKVVGIAVEAFSLDGMWNIIIRDNGKGIDMEKYNQSQHAGRTSIGMKNTFWRMETFFKDQSFSYQVRNGENGGCVILMKGKL